MNFSHIFSSDYLFSSTAQPPSAFFAVLTAGLAVMFLVSLFVYVRRRKLFPMNAAKRRFGRRVAEAGMWIAGTGLFLALMRYIELPYLSAPILMYLLLLGLIGLAGYYVYDYSERLPLATWRLQQAAAQQKFQRTPRQRPATRPLQPKVRGKQRRR